MTRRSLSNLVMVMVMVMQVAQGHAGPSTATAARMRRQIADVDSISDKTFICILAAETEGRDPSECTSNPAVNPNPTVVNPIPPVVEPNPEPVQLCPGGTCRRWWECDTNRVIADANGDLLSVVNVRTNVSPMCQSENDICCPNSTPVTPTTPRPFTPQCGRRNVKGVGTSFEGFKDRQSQFGEFPWMAAVMTSQIIEVENVNVYICGGSLIHPKVVLTAAHSVDKKEPSQLTVRLGEWNFREGSEPIPHQDFQVTKIAVHPKYRPLALEYDMALLYLDHEAVLGHTVDTICFPNPTSHFSASTCFSSGWGKDMFKAEGRYQQILKSIQLPAVNHQVCQELLRKTRLGPFFRLHSSFMCAGGEPGKDVCTGDGGSPLVCTDPNNPDVYVQAGIVAWGIGCAKKDVPGVYADVRAGLPWIEKELMDNMSFDIRNKVNVRFGV